MSVFLFGWGNPCSIASRHLFSSRGTPRLSASLSLQLSVLALAADVLCFQCVLHFAALLLLLMSGAAATNVSLHSRGGNDQQAQISLSSLPRSGCCYYWCPSPLVSFLALSSRKTSLRNILMASQRAAKPYLPRAELKTISSFTPFFTETNTAEGNV